MKLMKAKQAKISKREAKRIAAEKEEMMTSLKNGFWTGAGCTLGMLIVSNAINIVDRKQ